MSSVKILACEQTLCLGKGWKNREEPLLAIFFTLSPNRESVHRLWKSTLCVPRCKETNECFTVQPIKRLCNCIWWANTNGENKEIKKRPTYFWTWRSFRHAQRLGEDEGTSTNAHMTHVVCEPRGILWWRLQWRDQKRDVCSGFRNTLNTETRKRDHGNPSGV